MRPLVIIPGIFGNILRSEGKAVWAVDHTYQIIKWKKLLINYLGGYIDKQFKFNSWTGTHIIPDFGIKAIDRLMHSNLAKWFKITQLDYFDLLIKQLQNIGYKEDKNLFIYTYDFRQTLLTNEQLDRFQNFLNDIPKNPILLAHSMGGLIIRYYQHQRPQWKNYFNDVISVCVPFDGINGLGLLVPTAGYDFNNKFLEDATRMIWAQSGMTAALLPSSCNNSITQCVYIKKAIYTPTMIKKAENTKLWTKIKIIDDDKNSALLQILKYVVKNPETVQFDIQYWIQRFKIRFPTKIKIPYVFPQQRLKYVHSIHLADQDFFKPIYHDHPTIIKDDDWIWEQYTMWGPSENFIYPEFRVQKVPDSPKSNSQYDFFVQNQYENRSSAVPFLASQKSILDLYNHLTPAGTLENVVFGIEKSLFDAHYEARRRPISWPQTYKHRSIICIGVPTAVSCFYSQPIVQYQEILNRLPTPIYGEGDGSVTAVSQAADAIPGSIYFVKNGVNHKDSVRDIECINQIISWIMEFQ